MEFIQVIEFNTSRIDEFNAALDEWLTQTAGQRTATRGTQTMDRDQPNTYVQIIEFPSYEEAMANSNLPKPPRSPHSWRACATRLQRSATWM